MNGPVLIGGGLTGLVAAERLAAHGTTVPVLERAAEPGGICRSIVADGFTFDMTGHLLHTREARTRAYLEEIGVWDRLVEHERRAAVVIGDRFTPYPVQINTHALAPEVRRDCLLGFVRAWAAGEPSQEPGSFADWVLERFGEGLARHFFFPYNSKLFRISPEELTADWVGRYVPRPSLEEVVDGALGLHRGPTGYNATFRYPARGGIRMVPDAVAARVPGLMTGAEVVRISLAERWVERADGTRIRWSRLGATCALPALIDLLTDALPEEVAAARRALRWVAVLCVALGVEGEPPHPEHWLYFPDPKLPFYRVGFPSNHGRVAPPGSHTVSIELALDPSPGRLEETADEAVAALAGTGLLDPSRIRVRRTLLVDPAYVVFDRAWRDAVPVLRGFLERHGVFTAGRWGAWNYSAMEDAILDGFRLAERLAEGAPG